MWSLQDGNLERNCKRGSSIIDNTSQHGCHTPPRVLYNDSHAPGQRELVAGGIQTPTDLRIMHQILPIEVINLGIWNQQYCRYVDGNLIPIEIANRGMIVQRECLGTGVFIPRSFQNFKSKSQKNRGYHSSRSDSLHNPKNASFNSGKSTV
ncbi:uncharacterized protein LOC131028880 isoform X2 [Cryptomeria japonica]|uniref:uncharacterized protein LOC131028880 isoform X2 n=1 Tax=Cryptomeria japonica TaxID=3369 RepID=UPI0027DA49B3|nr:uncharacterized protein LOC131028880 isoform X2 [Cryptomeria japonica]